MRLSRVDVHAAEEGYRFARHEGDERMYQQQRNRQDGVQHRLPVALMVVRTHEEVCYEEDDDDGNQRQLSFHQ